MAIQESAGLHALYQVRIDGRIENQQTKNVMHFMQYSTDGDNDVETHLVLAILNCFITNLLPVMSSAWTLESATWKQLAPTLGNENQTVPAGILQGAGGADALPSYCSALLSIRTTLGGRSGKGRMFLPGIPENQTEGSLIDKDLAMWAALLAFAVCIIQTFGVKADPDPGQHAWAFGVFSRKLGGAAAPFNIAGFHPVTSIVPSALLATTRSRKIGHGN